MNESKEIHTSFRFKYFIHKFSFCSFFNSTHATWKLGTTKQATESKQHPLIWNQSWVGMKVQETKSNMWFSLILFSRLFSAAHHVCVYLCMIGLWMFTKFINCVSSPNVNKGRRNTETKEEEKDEIHETGASLKLNQALSKLARTWIEWGEVKAHNTHEQQFYDFHLSVFWCFAQRQNNGAGDSGKGPNEKDAFISFVISLFSLCIRIKIVLLSALLLLFSSLSFLISIFLLFSLVSAYFLPFSLSFIQSTSV